MVNYAVCRFMSLGDFQKAEVAQMLRKKLQLFCSPNGGLYSIGRHLYQPL